jgi:rSAM/selenodomain-associated transferase 1
MKSMQLTDQLTIFTRYPEPGLTKTRLISVLGEKGAAALQKDLTEKTIQEMEQLVKTSTIEPVICFDGGDLDIMQNWLGPDRVYKPQARGDLGEKLRKSFADAFSAGAQRVVTIGCDCPGLCREHISRAFDALYFNDLVLGPASDGGYYLIGIKYPLDALFEGISWGTDKVFEKTVSLAQHLGLSIEILEKLHDVDRPEDLRHIDHNSNP